MLKNITRIFAFLLVFAIVFTLLPTTSVEAAVHGGILYEVTNKDGAPVWSQSNSNSTKIRILSKGSQVTIEYTLRNFWNNEWGYTVNGTYIYMGNLKISNVKMPSTGDYVAVKDNVPLRHTPATEATIVKRINANTTVNVRKWYYNDRGNLWATAKIQNTEYEVFSENITKKTTPTPNPNPSPLPSPNPQPTPTPTPKPQPAPTPRPSPNPQPTPAPQPPAPAPSGYFQMGRDQYNFNNWYTSFGYSDDYRIPLETYISIYGQHRGRLLYDADGAWGGSCYGMSASSLMFLNGHLTRSSYQNGVNTTYNFSAPRSPQHPLTALIEKLQVSQYIPAINSYYNHNIYRIDALVRAVQNFEATGHNPVVAAVFGPSGGHAIVPFKIESVTNGYQISVWDSNHPNSVRTLLIDSNLRDWSFNGSGGFGSHQPNSWLGYVPYEVIIMHKDVTQQSVGSFLIAANTPTSITNAEGVSWEDIPDAQRLYRLGSLGASDDLGLYSLPSSYDYVITPISGSAIDVEIAGDAFHVQTDSSNAQAVIVSPDILDVTIFSDAHENHINLTIGTDDLECNLMLIVDGDLQIVEEDDRSLTLYGVGQVIEESGEDVILYSAFMVEEPEMSAYLPSDYIEADNLLSEVTTFIEENSQIEDSIEGDSGFSVDDVQPTEETSTTVDDLNLDNGSEASQGTVDNQNNNISHENSEDKNEYTDSEAASDLTRETVSTAVLLKLVPESLQGSYHENLTHDEFIELTVTLYETLSGELFDDETPTPDEKYIDKRKARTIGVVDDIVDEWLSQHSELTQEQVAYILLNLSKALDFSIPTDIVAHHDSIAVSEWAKAAVDFVQHFNIMFTDDTSFAPHEVYTREQGIIAIHRLYNLLVDSDAIHGIGE